jgi:hypothetical protein
MLRAWLVHMASHFFWVALFGVGVVTGGAFIAIGAFYSTFVLGFLGSDLTWTFIGGALVFTLTGWLCGFLIAAADANPRQVLSAAFASLIPTYVVLCLLSVASWFR